MQVLQKMATWPKFILALFSGVLLTISFPFTGSLFPLAFIAFIPLFLIEDRIVGRFKNLQLFSWAYLVFFLFNVGTTWWIYYADPGGAYMAFVFNSLLMALFYLAYYLIKKRLSSKFRFLIFAAVWISLEWFHFRWELSWPWLTLGNFFSESPWMVQWYSWTGVLGGSAWIIAMNALLYPYFSNNETKRHPKQLVLIFTLPILVSLGLYFTTSTLGKPYTVTVVQPNIDPYNTKFNLSNDQQLSLILNKAHKAMKKQQGMVIAPETALFPNGSMEETQLRFTTDYNSIQQFRKDHQHVDVYIGASTYHLFQKAPNNHAVFNDQIGGYPVSYNTSLLFSKRPDPFIVHKSKLVLGVEKIPFNSLFPSLEKLAINLGGSSGSLGIEPAPKVMKTAESITFSPIVCYESIYGAFLAEQAANGSQFLAIITNDGWWRDTPGYKQHFSFARLRAIENNRWVARSANTGSSGIINNRGDVMVKTGWWKESSFQSDIQLLEGKTLYQLLGDWIGIIALVLMFGFRIWAWKNRFVGPTQ